MQNAIDILYISVKCDGKHLNLIQCDVKMC